MELQRDGLISPALKKIKIGLLLPLPTPYRDPFIARLAKNDHIEIKALFLGKTCDTWDWKREPKCDFPHEFVDLPDYFKKKHYTRWIHPKLPKLLRSDNFDLLVIGGYFIPSEIMAAIWCIKNGIPYIIWFESHDRGLETTFWRKIIKQIIVEPLIKRASAYFAVGSYAREKILKSGVSPEKVYIILNSPDVDKWIKETDNLREKRNDIRKNLGLGDGSVLLFVGRMVPEKGLEELINAYRKIIKEGLTDNLELLLVGEGPLLKSLIEKCHKMGLDKVHFAGFVDPDNLYPYYAAADMFVLPSRYETFGVVVQEAAAARLPLIVSDCCGAAAEILHDQENGFIFKAGDYNSLAEKIVSLASLKNKWAMMGEKSRIIAKKFDFNHGEEQFMKAVQFSLIKRQFQWKAQP